MRHAIYPARVRVFAVARVVVAVLNLLFVCAAALPLASCASSQLMRVQCPESPRTYCPAQHPGDTAKSVKPPRGGVR